MGTRRRIYQQFIFIQAFLIAVPLEAVTVPSLCPTNKIAPHRRQISNWDYGKARTFGGAFIDLLAPNSLQFDAPNAPSGPNTPIQSDLQEQPQEDDPDDCGEIEDYDENDLSSITPQVQRRKGIRENKAFFPGLFGPSSANRPQRPPFPNYPPNRPPYPDYPSNRPPPNYPPNRPPYPDYPPNRPPPDYPPNRPPPDYPPNRPPSNYPPNRPPSNYHPNRPPTRPPYWSGGFFGTNDYRPPLQQNPTDDIKPIHENSDSDYQEPYHPGLVGGPSNHIVGVSPIRPTTDDLEATTRRIFPNRTPRYHPDIPEHTSRNPRYPEIPERTTSRPYHPNRTPPPTHNPTYHTRRPRPRNINNSGILGSFVDLLFK